MKRTLLSLAMIIATSIVLVSSSALAALPGKIVYVDAVSGDLRVRYLDTGQDLSIPYRPGIAKEHVRLSPLGDDRVAVWVSGRKVSGIRVFQFTKSGNNISVNLATEKTITASGSANWPTWSVNGEWIAYGDAQTKTKGLWVRKADGSGTAKRLFNSGDAFPFPVWSPNAVMAPDGKLISTRIACVVPTSIGSEKDIWTMDVSVDGTGNINEVNAAPLMFLAGLDVDLDWQPSGRIAFNFHMGQVLGQQIHTVDPAAADPASTLLQLVGGIEPRWSPDATMIAFRNGGDIWIMDANGTLMDSDPNTPQTDPFIIGSGHATWGP